MSEPVVVPSSPPSGNRPRLGILLSGAGSTYANLAEAVDQGLIAADIALVVSSKAAAGGLAKAAAFGHRSVVAREPAEVTAALLAAGVTHVAMCGWMRYWDPPASLAGRVVNIHPSLLPSFGGKGMYGHHVHGAVLAHGAKVSGCTVHLVAGDYDSGAILAQEVVPVLPDDTVEILQARVQAAERALYPRVVADLVAGRLRRTATGWWPGP